MVKKYLADGPKVPAAQAATYKYVPPPGAHILTEAGYSSYQTALEDFNLYLDILRAYNVEVLNSPDSGVYEDTVHHGTVTSYGFRIDYKGEEVSVRTFATYNMPRSSAEKALSVAAENEVPLKYSNLPQEDSYPYGTFFLGHVVSESRRYYMDSRSETMFATRQEAESWVKKTVAELTKKGRIVLCKNIRRLPENMVVNEKYDALVVYIVKP
ncbi:MAG: hypothetical protein WC421_11140 [Elusimicrobiales bacterium]